MQLQVRTYTYTKDTVPALRVIKDSLEQLQQDTTEAIDTVSCRCLLRTTVALKYALLASAVALHDRAWEPTVSSGCPVPCMTLRE